MGEIHTEECQSQEKRCPSPKVGCTMNLGSGKDRGGLGAKQACVLSLLIEKYAPYIGQHLLPE